MHNIFLVCTDGFYYKNRIFDLNNPFNRDNYYYPYYLLRKKFSEHNICLNTYDYFNKKSSKLYALIFFDVPKGIDKLLKRHKSINKFLVVFESEILNTNNWRRESHKHFKKIFVWNDIWIDGRKYIKYYWPNKIAKEVVFDLNKRNKFCTIIAGHKFVSHPLSLYAERIRAIRWFEQNHSEDFDLYGFGWDEYCFKGILSRLNRFKVLRKLFKQKYPSYRGTVKSKSEVLQEYKFAICYENAMDIPGYITEKIFDCFFAGCVPVYWGAPNVSDYIPLNTFIDKRNFRNYEELYSYLKNMPDKEYLGYLDAIKRFVRSEKIRLFSAEYFADTLVSEVLKDYQEKRYGD